MLLGRRIPVIYLEENPIPSNLVSTVSRNCFLNGLTNSGIKSESKWWIISYFRLFNGFDDSSNTDRVFLIESDFRFSFLALFHSLCFLARSNLKEKEKKIRIREERTTIKKEDSLLFSCLFPYRFII